MSGRRVVFSTIFASAATIFLMMMLWTLGSAAAAPVAGSDAGARSVGILQGGPGGEGGRWQAAPGELGDADSGPDLATGSPAAVFSYWQVLGWNMKPRNNSTPYTYDDNGCVHMTGGGDYRFMFPVNLPNGSVIKYLRFYYNDGNASDLSAHLSLIAPGTGVTDLVWVDSVGSSGLGTQLSAEITHTVNNMNGSYQVTAIPGVPLSVSQICGVRIAYYAPLGAAGFMPMIRH